MALSAINLLSELNSRTFVLTVESPTEAAGGLGGGVKLTDTALGVTDEDIALKLKKVTAAEYGQIVMNSTALELSDCLFDIRDTQLNALDEKIVNVAEPTENSDAATKGYVDSKIPTQISELNNNAGYLTENALNGYLNATHVNPILTEGT